MELRALARVGLRRKYVMPMQAPPYLCLYIDNLEDLPEDEHEVGGGFHKDQIKPKTKEAEVIIKPRKISTGLYTYPGYLTKQMK